MAALTQYGSWSEAAIGGALHPAQGSIRSQNAPLVLKPVFSGLPVSKALQLNERLKTFVGYTASSNDQHFRLWEGGSVAISGLQGACLVRSRTCMIVACTKLDLGAPAPCALLGQTLAATASTAASPRAGIQDAIAERNAARREDVVIYSAAVTDGKPRFLHSRL